MNALIAGILSAVFILVATFATNVKAQQPVVPPTQSMIEPAAPAKPHHYAIFGPHEGRDYFFDNVPPGDVEDWVIRELIEDGADLKEWTIVFRDAEGKDLLSVNMHEYHQNMWRK